LDVVTMKCDNSAAQQWDLKSATGGSMEQQQRQQRRSKGSFEPTALLQALPPMNQLVTITQRSTGFLLDVADCAITPAHGPGSNLTVHNGSDAGCAGLNTLFSFNTNGTITTGLDGQCVNLYAKPGDPRYNYDVQTYRCDGGKLQDNDKWTLTAAGEIKSQVGDLCLTTGPPLPPTPPLVWVGELAHGDWTVLLVNGQEQPATLSFDLGNINLTETANSANNAPSSAANVAALLIDTVAEFKVRDLWRHKDLPGTYTQNDMLNFTDVGGHDCIMLRLSRAKPMEPGAGGRK
jgi:hypothetical protein